MSEPRRSETRWVDPPCGFIADTLGEQQLKAQKISKQELQISEFPATPVVTKRVLVAKKNKSREQEKGRHVSKFYYRIKGSVDPPASPHGAGVATGDNNVLPVQESHEQKTEEDDFLLSTRQTSKPVQKLQFGSIDWSMIPASSHEAEDDSLSTTSTVDYGSDYTEKEYPTDSEDDEIEDPIDKKISCLKIPIVPHKEWPDRDEWIASWKQLCQLRRFTWIDVYAYFKKGKGYGGYGVILRDVLAKPIIASAKFSKDGKSFFYQVLMGVKAGVELAKKHQRTSLNVYCNSQMVVALFDDVRRCSDNRCRDTCDLSYVCTRCQLYLSRYVGCKMRAVVGLVLQLRGYVEELTTGWGKAAHYLAKREKKIKMLEAEKKGVCFLWQDDDKPVEMKPGGFPEELKNILWQDAFDKSVYKAVPFIPDDSIM